VVFCLSYKNTFIETAKRGKWRRWLAKVYLKDVDKTLNEELVEKGPAKIAK